MILINSTLVSFYSFYNTVRHDEVAQKPHQTLEFHFYIKCSLVFHQGDVRKRPIVLLTKQKIEADQV